MPVSDNPRDYTWGKRKKNLVLFISIGVVVVLALVVAGYFVFQSDVPGGDATNTQEEEEESDVATRKLDGVEVSPEEANVFPWAIMVENLSTTRPQSGLSQAGVVYEALAEGGITRFLLIFATHEEIKNIGPVRSARPYFVDWANEYNGAYAHVGGSPQGIARISELNITDFDQFYNSQYYRARTDRNAPHHIFTDSRLLTFAARDEEFPATGDFIPWKFGDDIALDARPVEEKKISIDFSTYSYEVEYSYDRGTNTYLRSQGGAVFSDENTDKQIAPKNVILQFVGISNYDVQRLDLTTIGSGKAIVFHDGTATEGTWKKETSDSRTKFYDASGNEITLTRGQTWVEVLEKDRDNYSYL